MTALVISFVIGPKMIAWLTRMKIGQSVRDDGPQTHLAKAGTPTMGGALILVSIAITTLLWGDLDNRFVLGLQGVFSWNMNQPGVVDINLDPARGFALPTEAGRPVFVDPSFS